MKYTKEQNLELRKAVANFNKKWTRLKEKGVSPSLLPNKASVRNLKRAYDNKRDLNARLKELSKFTSKGEVRENKYGIQGTNDLFKYTQRRIDKSLQHVKRMQKKVKRMKTPYKSVREDAELNLEAKAKFLDKDIEEVDLKTLQRLNKNALDQEQLAKKQETYVKNNMEMLYQLTEYSDYDPEKRKIIEQELSKLTPAQFSELSETDPTIKSIREQYEAMKKEAKTIKEQLFNVNILNETLTLQNKLDALYDALPVIKDKYGIK